MSGTCDLSFRRLAIRFFSMNLYFWWDSSSTWKYNRYLDHALIFINVLVVWRLKKGHMRREMSYGGKGLINLSFLSPSTCVRRCLRRPCDCRRPLRTGLLGSQRSWAVPRVASRNRGRRTSWLKSMLETKSSKFHYFTSFPLFNVKDINFVFTSGLKPECFQQLSGWTAARCTHNLLRGLKKWILNLPLQHEKHEGGVLAERGMSRG